MDFYISWSRSDPVFPEYFPDCNMLVSPCNLTANFSFKKFHCQPRRVIVDSSAFFYLSSGKALPPQRRVFEQQLRIIDGCSCPVLLCPLDNPIPPVMSGSPQAYSLMEKTLANAYEFMELYVKHGLDRDSRLEPMGIIQGFDRLSIQFWTGELQRLGFAKFGLGSLAPLFNPVEISSRVQAAVDMVGEYKLHVFGISRLDTFKYFRQTKIMSLDSTRPTKAAIFNGIFYSNPFRTYGISDARNSDAYPQVLAEPLPCDCPICQENPTLIMKTGLKKYINARAIHNYYHLVIKHLNNK